MFQCKGKVLSVFILIILVAAGFIVEVNSQNTTAVSGNSTSSQQAPLVNKEVPKVIPQNPVTSNTTATIPESPKTASASAFSFNKWAITFQCPGEWKEWEAEKSVYAKESLNERLKQFDIEMLEFTMIMSPNEDVAILVSKSQRVKPIIIEELVKERENVYKDAQAAGDVTKVNKLEQTTIDYKPAIIEDVERSNGGRAISMKVIAGQKVFEISLIAKDKNNFETFRPVFEQIMKTVTIRE